MANVAASAPGKNWKYWTGWVVSVLPCLLMLMSGVMKFIQPGDFAANFEKMGWPIHLAIALGVVEIACTVLYLIPQTAVLGAILLTGYMGGAIATHLRLQEMIIPQVIIGMLFWLGLYLRDARIRALLPFN